MGQLVTLNQLEQGLGWDWYFTEFGSNKQPVIQSTFPFSLAINKIEIDEAYAVDYQLKNRIREWVEDSVTGYVVLEIIEKSYYHYWSDSHEYGDNITWSYHVFHFRHQADAVAFKLAFNDVISEVKPYDPNRIPNFLQRAYKQLAKAKEWQEKVEFEYADKDEYAPLSDLLQTYDAHLTKWDGEQELIFGDKDEAAPNKVLQRRYHAIHQLRYAEKDLSNILDIHSTFVPKSRY